jgi:site-specific DNA recombinase
MLIAIYIRVSTEEQTEGYSLSEQERLCRAYCATRWPDATIRIYADEGLSAFKDQLSARPALAQLLADVRLGRIAGVVVQKLDRFFRRAKLLIATVEELLDQLHVTFVSVSEQIDFSTPAGRVMLANLGAFAEYYSRNLSAETKKGLAGKARAGDWVGPVPFGYERDGRTLQPSAHAPIVQRIYELYSTGDHSFPSIAEQLNTEGHRLMHWREGDKPFGREAIRSILSNPAYRGLVSCKGVQAKGQHPPIVDADLWYECEAIRVRRAQNRGAVVVRGVGGLLSELAYCARCGARMWHHRSGNSGKWYYRCGKRAAYGKEACPVAMAPAEELDDAALNVLRALRVAPHLHGPIIARAEELLKPAAQPNQIDRATVERQLERLEKVYLSGDTAITDGLYIAERARLKRIMTEAPPPPPLVVDLQKATATLSNMGELLDQSDASERRGVLLSVFSALWVEPGNIKAITPTGRFQLLVEAMASVEMCGGCPTGFEPATS